MEISFTQVFVRYYSLSARPHLILFRAYEPFDDGSESTQMSQLTKPNKILRKIAKPVQ